MMRINASGNVGIGTTGPGSKLSFGLTGVGTDLIRFYDGGGTNNYGIGVQGSEIQSYQPSSGHWSFNSGGAL